MLNKYVLQNIKVPNLINYIMNNIICYNYKQKLENFTQLEHFFKGFVFNQF